MARSVIFKYDRFLAEASLLALLFFFPWIIRPTGDIGIHQPKTVALVIFAGACLLPAIRSRPWSHWFGRILLALWVLALLSTLNGRDTLVMSLFGSYQRSDGLLYVTALTIVVLFAYSVFRRSRASVERFMTAYVAIGVIQAVIVVSQWFGFDPMNRFVFHRTYFIGPYGTIANTGFAAGLLLAPLVICVVRLSRSERWRSTALWAAAAVVLSVAIAFTDNKASVYALAVTLALAVAFRRQRWRLLAAALLVVAAVAGGRLAPDPHDFRSSYAPDAGRSVSARETIWRLAASAIRGIPGEPFLGAGADAFDLAQFRGWISPRTMALFFDRHWPAGSKIVSSSTVRAPGQPERATNFLYKVVTPSGDVRYYNQVPVVDRAHNIVLDTIISYGLISACLLVFLFLWPAVRRFRSNDPTIAALSMTAIALWFFYQTWFPAVATWVFHLLVLTALWAALEGRSKLQDSAPSMG